MTLFFTYGVFLKVNKKYMNSYLLTSEGVDTFILRYIQLHLYLVMTDPLRATLKWPSVKLFSQRCLKMSFINTYLNTLDRDTKKVWK